MPRSILPRGFFDKEATVYAEDTATGLYTDAVETELPCRLMHVDARAAPTSEARATLAAERTLAWPPEYFMPAYAQIEINDTRWNPVEINAFQAIEGPDGATIYRQVPVRKVS